MKKLHTVQMANIAGGKSDDQLCAATMVGSIVGGALAGPGGVIMIGIGLWTCYGLGCMD